MFTNFSETKNVIRNLEIKNLGWFGKFSDDCSISHRNFGVNLMQFDGIYKIEIYFKFIINLIQFDEFSMVFWWIFNTIKYPNFEV